jgi:hypothetical protein
MISYVAVEKIKQLPERVYCFPLAFHGNAVYSGGKECVIQWNVVTNAVARLTGHSGLIFMLFFP